MADKLPTIPPPSRPFPGSLTPGWNDPPPINDVSRPPGRTRLILNKRVAYPVQSETRSSLDSSTKSTVPVQHNQLPIGNLPQPHTLLAHPLSQEFRTDITNSSKDVTAYAIEENQHT